MSETKRFFSGRTRAGLPLFAAAFLAAAPGCSPPPAAGPGPVTVAVVFDIGGRGDGGFNDSAFRGLERAVNELGIRAVLKEPRRNLERKTALDEALASDAGLVIGVGSSFADELFALAARHPAKAFVCIDDGPKFDREGRPVPLPANLAGVGFREEEGSYLMGVIAALKSRTGKIGFLGGMDGPVIRRFEAGFTAGARAVRPEIVIFSKFAGLTARAFNDPPAGYRLTSRMSEDGADVIYQAAGGTGLGLFQAAKERNLWAIGTDSDQHDLAPGRVLTSMLKRVDVAVFENIKAFAEGRFSGGLKTLGLKEDGVGFVLDDRNRDWIGPEAVEAVLAIREKIVAGALAVPAGASSRPRVDRAVLLDVLAKLREDISDVLNALDGDLGRSAAALSGLDLGGDRAREILKGLYESHPYIIDCETVSDRGIMVAVEPAGHRASEGADIGAQAHMVRLFQTHRPVLSGSFRSVEGPEAAALHHPVFSADGTFAGSVSALFSPEYLLGSAIGTISANLPVDVFLMQTDGRVIYDADPKQVGLDVFTDPFYKPFPELRALAGKVAAGREGTGEYRFLEKGSGPETTEIAFWTTTALRGTEWRLVITCAREGLED